MLRLLDMFSFPERCTMATRTLEDLDPAQDPQQIRRADIEKLVRRAIREGSLFPGDRVSANSFLGPKVRRSTANRAFDSLAQNGLLLRQLGGPYVVPERTVNTRRARAPFALSRVAAEQEWNVASLLDPARSGPIEARTTAELPVGLALLVQAQGPSLIRIRRLRGFYRIDREVTWSVVDTTWLPKKSFPDVLRRIGRVVGTLGSGRPEGRWSLHDYFRGHELPLYNSTYRAEIAGLDAGEAEGWRTLVNEEPDPAWFSLECTTYSSESVPMAYTVTKFRPGSLELQMTDFDVFIRG